MGLLKKIIVLVLLVVAGWYSFNFKKEEAKNHKSGKGGPITVSVATAKTGSIDAYLQGLGNITPPSTAVVHSRVDGQLMRILFKEGQLVKENQLLAELDDRPFTAQLTQAQGQMMRDQALLGEAKINLERYQTLFKQDSIAKQQLDAQASLVKQYEGAVKNDQGLIDNAKLQITYTKITAPFAGAVGLRQVDIGNIVHAGDTNGIVVVTQLQPITAIFTLPEDNIPLLMKHMQAGDNIVAEAWDRENKNKIATGVLSAVDNQVDPATGTVKVRAQFPNTDNALFPSQFVNIRARIETKDGVTLIPTTSILRGAKGTFVYTVSPDNTVTVTPVKTDVAEGDNTAISEGIKPGDVVVSDGVDNLSDGAKIEIPASTPAKEDDKAVVNSKDKEKHHKNKKKGSE